MTSSMMTAEQPRLLCFSEGNLSLRPVSVSYLMTSFKTLPFCVSNDLENNSSYGLTGKQTLKIDEVKAEKMSAGFYIGVHIVID